MLVAHACATQWISTRGLLENESELADGALDACAQPLIAQNKIAALVVRRLFVSRIVNPPLPAIIPPSRRLLQFGGSAKLLRSTSGRYGICPGRSIAPRW